MGLYRNVPKASPLLGTAVFEYYHAYFLPLSFFRCSMLPTYMYTYSFPLIVLIVIVPSVRTDIRIGFINPTMETLPMTAGGDGVLTLTVSWRVSPEPVVLDLMKRYRTALNLSVQVLVVNRVTSVGKAHALLYDWLKTAFNLPSRVAIDCYREALAIVKSWLRNPRRGRIPRVKALRMWLSPGTGYRVKGDYVELIGGYRLRVIGKDPRYGEYPNREARLVYRNGELFLKITKRIPRPEVIQPKTAIGSDFNERKVVFGNY